MTNTKFQYQSDDILIDLRISCSREDAAAKLLGLKRGPIFKRFIPISLAAGPNGIAEDQLQHIHSFETTISGSLEGELMALRDFALIRFDEAVELEEMDKHVCQVQHWENDVRKYVKYLCAIAEELAKGDASMLRIDKSETERLGSPQIYLNSLETWARSRGLWSVNATGIDEPSTVKQKSQSPTMADDLSTENGLTRDVANTLYTDFAYLIDAYAKDRIGNIDNKAPVINTIAKRIEMAVQNDGGALRGHSAETIRKYMAQAMDVKDGKRGRPVVKGR